jgi:hypothetical protein
MFMQKFTKWNKKLQRWQYAWIVDANPFIKGWYNARINYSLTKDFEFGFYYDNCKDSLWRYWDGEQWSVACSQCHTREEIGERLKEFHYKTEPEAIAWNSEYPNWIGRY